MTEKLISKSVQPGGQWRLVYENETGQHPYHLTDDKKGPLAERLRALSDAWAGEVKSEDTVLAEREIEAQKFADKLSEIQVAKTDKFKALSNAGFSEAQIAALKNIL